MAGGKDGKAPVIVIKKKKGGHNAAHGGAWKVAFADFMTAMMCFFLVMWLMGADEATRSAVAEYFNNPTSAWRPDLASKESMPLGSKTGSGDNIKTGNEGQVPEDLVERPSREFMVDPEQAEKKTEEVIEDTMRDRTRFVNMDIDFLKMSLPENALFEDGSDQFRANAKTYLERIGKIIKDHKGKLAIRGYHSPDREVSYEFVMTRMVALSKYISKNKFMDETRIKTLVSDATKNEKEDREPAQSKSGRIEFILSGP